MIHDPSAAQVRGMNPAELEQLGRHSLREHLIAQAIAAYRKHGPLTPANLEALLNDPECLRHPTRIVHEHGEMALHQFAHPDVDWCNSSKDGRVLYVRPLFRHHPELLPLAVAYMIPALNYGEIVSDAHCLAYGATLLGILEDEFYQAVCQMSDRVGAKPLFPESFIPHGCPQSHSL